MALAKMAGTGGGTGDNDPPPVFREFLAAITSDGHPTPAVRPKAAAAFWDMTDRTTLAGRPASTCCGSLSARASSGGHGHGFFSCSSERRGVNNSEVFHFNARKNIMSGPDLRLSGQKRGCSDSTYTGLLKERALSSASDSFRTSNLFKIYGKELINWPLRRYHDDEYSFSMQTPPRPTSVTLNPFLGSELGSVTRHEQFGSPNHGQIISQALHSSQIGAKLNIDSSGYGPKGFSVGASVIFQPAADEGSRTGIIGSGKNISTNNMASERSLPPFSPRSKMSTDINRGCSNITSFGTTATTTRQMTIFFAGQAHVFDDVHPNKADLIMALAGSSGGSWSTTYEPKSTCAPSQSNPKYPADKEILGGNQGRLGFKDARQMTEEAAPKKHNAE